MNIFKDFDCVIFDFDGTLVDSIGVWKDIDIKFMAKRNLPIPDDFYAKVSVLNLWQAAEYVIDECGVTDSPEDIVAEWLAMSEYEYANNIAMIKGAKEFIFKLKENGIKICLATAAGESQYKPCLEHHGVYDMFDAFVTTNEVKRKKGYPDVYMLAAERVGAKPERCCVFEDIYLGVVGAKAGDFACVAVMEEHSKEWHDKIKELADVCVNDYTELM